MAIGLDTSVVVRLLVGLPESQAQTARRRLERAVERGEHVLVCDLVLAEAYHALQQHYKVPESEARSILEQFATSNVVEVDPPDAVAAFEERRGAGFVDRLIHARYRSLGAVTTTFEKKQGALEGAVRLRARKVSR
jgi:predicted nucleic acid-binding protein